MNRYYYILLVMSATITIFSSCKKEKDWRIYDKGVVINGIKWAQRNVDKPGTFADRPETPGMFYKWNSKTGWSFSDPLTPSDGKSDWNEPREGYFAEKWEDINNVCPKGWRLPTVEEFNNLLSYTGVDNIFNHYTAYATLNGKDGHTFGRDNNRIFLPVVGYRDDYSGISTTSSYWYKDNFSTDLSYYWCGDSYYDSGHCLLFTKTTAYVTTENKNNGFCVRCVAE